MIHLCKHKGEQLRQKKKEGKSNRNKSRNQWGRKHTYSFNTAKVNSEKDQNMNKSSGICSIFLALHKPSTKGHSQSGSERRDTPPSYMGLTKVHTAPCLILFSIPQCIILESINYGKLSCNSFILGLQIQIRMSQPPKVISCGARNIIHSSNIHQQASQHWRHSLSSQPLSRALFLVLVSAAMAYFFYL